MARRSKLERKRRNGAQILGLALIGSGLLVLGLVALVLLPKPNAAASRDTGASAVPVQVDFIAPDLRLADLQGDPVSLADYRGQVVLVNNWATWCPPCLAEMPVLQAFYEDHHAQGFTIVAIEAGEPAAEVAAFAKRYELTFPVWVDREQQALTAFRNYSLPNSYVIDRSGTVRLAWAGAISQEMLEKYVTPLVEE